MMVISLKQKKWIINNNIEINNFIKLKKYNLINNNNNDYFQLIDIIYFYSFKYNIMRVEYAFGFYDVLNNLILPSDVSLYKNIHIFCHVEKVNDNISINSYPIIYENNYYKCREFFYLNENVKFGINIYQSIKKNEKLENIIINFFSEKILKYQLMNKNDIIFDSFILNKEYIYMVKKMNSQNINETFLLKKSFIKYPHYFLNKNDDLNNNEWYFLNIYNIYFCFCKGLCMLDNKSNKKCKYYFYLNIIDNNRNKYNKTDILFIDFIFNDFSSDDAFPIFEEMINENLPVHYLTENLDIYNSYCYQNNKCLKVIIVDKNNYTINGDFLENYLTLILKLKVVVSCSGIYFNYINNIFYNIEYITYISVTHGVCYFKYFLYNEYECYGRKSINKIVIPPCKKIISLAKKYGWKDSDIIKLYLPKWDKNKKMNDSEIKEKFTNNSILLMFTWREIKKGKTISSYYFKNIIDLIKNVSLNKELYKTNTTLYFTFHHKIKYNYKDIIKTNKYVQYVIQNEISDCLKKVNLVVSDFSSIIFDMIYKEMPFIIYIPDANDKKIESKYSKNYYELIHSMKNGTFEFENIYFDINKTIDKIFYYIKNDFKLEQSLKNFYFNLMLKKKSKNNKKVFIEYLKNLK